MARYARALATAQGLPADRAIDTLPALRRARERVLPAGQHLCKQGDRPEGIAFLVDGRLSVQLEEGDRSQTVAFISAPAIVGHIGVVDDGDRSATVRAELDSTYLWMSVHQARNLIAEDGLEAEGFRELLMAAMFESLAVTTLELRDVMAQIPRTAVPLAD